MTSSSATQTVTLPIEGIFELAHIRDFQSGLTLDDRELLLEQAQTLLDYFYVHLPLKRSMLAIDPIQRIKLLRNESSYYPSETAFNSELLSIFISLGDLHTNFVLPDPWNQMIAFLPFMIEEYYDTNGYPHYIVTKVSAAIGLSDFRPGVEVTHWNGSPMHRKLLELSSANARGLPVWRRCLRKTMRNQISSRTSSGRKCTEC